MIKSRVPITQPSNFTLLRRTLRYARGISNDLVRLNWQLSLENARKSTFVAMRSQSRPSIDSRSLIECWETNDCSPLENCHEGAIVTVRMALPSLCLVRAKSPVFKANSFCQAFKFFGPHWTYSINVLCEMSGRSLGWHSVRLRNRWRRAASSWKGESWTCHKFA